MSSGNVTYWLNKLNKTNAYHELLPTVDNPGIKGRYIADGSIISISLQNKNGIAKATLNLCSLLDIGTQKFILFQSHVMNIPHYHPKFFN